MQNNSNPFEADNSSDLDYISPHIIYQNLKVIPPGVTYYIIYFFCATLGILGNLILLYAVRNRFGPFGERQTFTFLVKFICILDIILSASIFVDILLLNVLVRLKHYDYFVHPRNVVLTIESYALLLIALDRYLAIKRPFSQRWSCYLVYIILGFLITITVIFDISTLINKQIHFQIAVFFIYIGVYTIIFVLIMVLTYTIYFLLFIAFIQYTQYNVLRIQRMSTLRLRESESQRGVAGDPDSPEVDNIEQRTRWNYRCRLARTLFIVTFVYTFSMVPHILAGWELIPFPGYLVYNLFYLNAVANPFIYITTDAHFRRDLVKHFRAPRPASMRTTSRAA